MFSEGMPYEGSREAMKALGKLGRVHIVTMRPKRAETFTMEWLDRHGIVAHEVHILGSGQKKSIDGPKVDVMIDDRWENVLDMSRVSKSFLMLRPWNRKFAPSWPLVVRSLGEFVEEVKKL